MTSRIETQPITDETLSAYVDGELRHGEAALVARSAATDPKVAERIAVLQGLKAGVAGMVDDVVVIDPRMPVARGGHRRSWSWALGAFAAAIIVAVSVVWLAAPTGRPIGNGEDRLVTAHANGWIEGFVIRHDAWIDAAEPVVTTQSFDFQLEDLMARSGLRLVHHTLSPIGEALEARHTAFVGQRGCRLSLFQAVSPSDLTAPLTIMIDAGLLTANWAHEGRSYALVTRNMDSTRFATIAATVHGASRDLGAVDVQALARLQQARQPCLS
jgi:anti-sigma factor RsiW